MKPASWLHVLILALVVATLLCGSALADFTPPHVAALHQMVIYVRDQHGTLTLGAQLIVRDRETYAMVAQGTTNAQGFVVLILDPARWYVVHVYHEDQGTREIWAYTYIKAEDWGGIYPYAEKTIRRTDPWIAQVSGPTEPLRLGQPIVYVASAAHGLVQTNFDLLIRFRFWIDDDGHAPYLYEALSPTQEIGQGFQPVTFSYQPEKEGAYRVRVLIERRFEANEWVVADEGGWSWAVQIGEPTYDLAGCVFRDDDHDGLRDAGERPLQGITLELMDAQKVSIASQITGADGLFAFHDLGQGIYRLALRNVPPSFGYASTGYVVPVNADTPWLDIALSTWTLHVPLARAR